jgi:hypothetical protein
MKNKKTNMMIVFSFLFITILFDHTIFSTSNWKSTGSSGGNDDEQLINFYGTLTTHQGQKDAVGHILIEGKHKDIIMYDAPVKHAEEVFNQRTKQTEIKLAENPITDFSSAEIDLSSISSIKSTIPNTIWVYQKEKKYQRIEFIMVTVTSKESSVSKNYLLERKTHISCNTIDNISQKKKVPLTAIDTLTIEGYSFSIGADQVKKNRPAHCPAKVTLGETTALPENNIIEKELI